MGRSSTSCLKIIACGSDAAANDDVDSHEAKASGDKRGWSFRKRSGRHRVLGNNVSSETSTVMDKEISQGINTEFQSPIKSNSVDEKPQLPRPVEKISEAVIATEHVSEPKTSAVVVTSENDSSAVHAEPKMSNANSATHAEPEMPQAVVSLEESTADVSADSKLASPVVVSGNDSDTALAESKMGDSVVVLEVDRDIELAESTISDSVVASENGGDAGATMDLEEPFAVTIQTAIRGFLAQREFIQLKSAIKLQAAIRGHLVRRNAVESLHCIRAIVKVQALVRARSSKRLDHKSVPNDAQFSTVKLLRNSFARQLLESTPKSKSVNIRCDPLRPNSAWEWLERWMSVSTSEVDKKLEGCVEPEHDIHVQETPVQADADFSSMVVSDSVNSELNATEEANLQKNDEDHVFHDVNNVDLQSCYPLSTEMTTEQSHTQRTEIIKDNMTSLEMDVLADESSHIQEEAKSPVDKPAFESKQPKLSSKRSASEELDGEGKKYIYGSRKASNPAFIAAQSKFEELSSAANSGKSVSSSHQDVGAESHVDTASSVEETIDKTNDPSAVETAPCNPQSHVAGSECGTELSISSTLDSPDRSDFGNAEAHQNKFLQEMLHDPAIREGPGGEANGSSNRYVTDLSCVPIQQEKADRIDGESVDAVVAEVRPQEEQKLDTSASDLQANIERSSSVMTIDSSQMEQKNEVNGFDMQIEHGFQTEHHAYKSSPGASPKSHMTVPESQGTPSSQVSVKSKRNKIDKSGSNTKRTSLSGGKRSQSNPGLDSGARSSTENLPKDQKTGKRRNSFGSTKSDNTDQEPRDSSTRNTLPSYMQATESARAKAHSPRSSPDVHDKEVYSKKRHSLPGATGRQGSPRIQRTTSQETKGAKANGSNERKWQR